MSRALFAACLCVLLLLTTTTTTAAADVEESGDSPEKGDVCGQDLDLDADEFSRFGSQTNASGSSSIHPSSFEPPVALLLFTGGVLLYCAAPTLATHALGRLSLGFSVGSSATALVGIYLLYKLCYRQNPIVRGLVSTLASLPLVAFLFPPAWAVIQALLPSLWKSTVSHTPIAYPWVLGGVLGVGGVVGAAWAYTHDLPPLAASAVVTLLRLAAGWAIFQSFSQPSVALTFLLVFVPGQFVAARFLWGRSRDRTFGPAAAVVVGEEGEEEATESESDRSDDEDDDLAEERLALEQRNVPDTQNSVTLIPYSHYPRHDITAVEMHELRRHVRSHPEDWAQKVRVSTRTALLSWAGFDTTPPPWGGIIRR